MTETTQELLARLMQHVEDTMIEAKADYPSDRLAGQRISYDSNFLQKCFEAELTAAPDLHRIVTEQAAEIALLRDALVVIAQAKRTSNAAVNVQTIWNVTERARAALQVQP